MKKLIILITLLFLIGCESKTKTDALEDKTTATHEVTSEEETVDYQVALDFLNSYIEENNAQNFEIIEWVEASPLVTKQFKIELMNLLAEAFEEDPEYGLGFDPIFDAQDYPDEGFEIVDADSATGYVKVKGINWDDFTVTMKVANQNGQMLVDGCGVINIPLDKRAER